MSVNSCVFSGNLTKDVEVKDVGEHKVAKFSVAVNRFVKGEKKVSFFEFEAWNKTAEFMEQYAKKGSAVTVVAEARQDTWEDKESGKSRSKVYFAVNNLQLHGKKDSKGGGTAVEDTVGVANDADVPF